MDATVEASPGGVYRVNVTGTNHAVGEYVEIDPPRRVVFTWGWEGDEQLPPGSSTVTIELVPDGDATIVRLTHSGLPEGADAAQLAGMGALPAPPRRGRERRRSRSRPLGLAAPGSIPPAEAPLARPVDDRDDPRDTVRARDNGNDSQSRSTDVRGEAVDGR